MRTVFFTAATVTAAILVGLLLSEQASPELIWLRKQADRCTAMRGQLHYDRKSQTAECYRMPFARHPKLAFEETFKP